MYSSVNLSFKTFEDGMGNLWNYDKKCSIEKGYCNEWYNEPWCFTNEHWKLKDHIAFYVITKSLIIALN